MQRTLVTGMALLIGVATLLASVAARAEAPHPPKRLVLAMDAVPFATMQALQAEGAFPGFYPVSRMVSTFPSLSDVAWADVFETIPPPGYQRYHYTVRGNKIVGRALADLTNPLDYELSMNMAFGNIGHHIRSYLSPMSSAKTEMRLVPRIFLRTQEADAFYVFMLSSDTIQHTDGDLVGLLHYVDAQLCDLAAKYQRLTGEKLEILILSDHANTHKRDGIRVPLRRRLREYGYNVVHTIQEDNDVVFTSVGILSSVAIYAKPRQVEAIARHLSRVEGIDIITYTDSTCRQEVKVINSQGAEARIVKHASENAYAYLPERGDPLQYLPVVAALSAAGKVDAEGFATSDDWLTASVSHVYPVAPERIYRGHYALTLNPAPILVSLKDGYENAASSVKLLAHLKKRGGTHGGLSASNSAGMVISNFMPTVDTTTDRVSGYFNLTGLNDYRKQEKGARILETPAGGISVSLWDPGLAEAEASGVTTSYHFLLKRNVRGPCNVVVAEVELAAADIPKTDDGLEFHLPFKVLLQGKGPVRPGNYFLKIRVRRRGPNGSAGVSDTSERMERLETLRFFTDTQGQFVAY